MFVVVSDVHLSYDAYDKEGFNNFIDDELMKLNDNLVLLGDDLGLWRESCIDLTKDYKKISKYL